jgi:hypothetical protein
MYSTANGANTDSVITSSMIFNCDTDSCVWPIGFAGTWSKYSKQAIATTRQGGDMPGAVVHILEMSVPGEGHEYIRCGK